MLDPTPAIALDSSNDQGHGGSLAVFHTSRNSSEPLPNRYGDWGILSNLENKGIKVPGEFPDYIYLGPLTAPPRCWCHCIIPDSKAVIEDLTSGKKPVREGKGEEGAHAGGGLQLCLGTGLQMVDMGRMAMEGVPTPTRVVVTLSKLRWCQVIRSKDSSAYCVESVVLSLEFWVHITTQYKYNVRCLSLRYGYTIHPFGSEYPYILHRWW